MEKLFERQDTLMLFLTFVVPGFIMLKIYDMFVPGSNRDTSKALIDTVVYSSINMAVFLPLIWAMRSGWLGPVPYFVSAGLILLVAPVCWPYVILKLRRSKRIMALLPHPLPQPWACVFEQRKPYWAIVHLKDERRIAGLYGPNSFSSSDPEHAQIYLEQVWLLDEDGKFKEPVLDSAGIIVLEGDMLAVELFEIL